MAMVMHRFDVVLVNLDPTVGHEITKARPCLIISPDVLNLRINTVIVAPMTTVEKYYPTRISCTFHNKKGQIVLEQIRTIDKKRIIKKLGTVDSKTSLKVIDALQRLFSF